MKLYLSACVLGLAIAIAWLGPVSNTTGHSAWSKNYSPDANSTYTASGSIAHLPHQPGSHKDSNTEAINVALNPNIILGRHTVICTADAELFPALDEAVNIWNTALRTLAFRPTTGPLLLPDSKKSTPGPCKDQASLDVHIVVQRGTCMDPSSNGCYRRSPKYKSNPPHQGFQSSTTSTHALIIYRKGRVVRTSTLVHELGHVLGLSDYKQR